MADFSGRVDLMAIPLVLYGGHFTFYCDIPICMRFKTLIPIMTCSVSINAHSKCLFVYKLLDFEPMLQQLPPAELILKYTKWVYAYIRWIFLFLRMQSDDVKQAFCMIFFFDYKRYDFSFFSIVLNTNHSVVLISLFFCILTWKNTACWWSMINEDAARKKKQMEQWS